MPLKANGLGGESEAEGSSHGWSDQGWATNTRPSLSSNEDIDLHQTSPSVYTTSQSQFQQSASHRRQPIINRNDVHTAGSNITLDTLSDRPSSVILNVASPTTDISSSNGSSYPSEGFLNYPRARRKSITKDLDSEDETEGLYHASGSYGRSSTSVLPKKKRRTSSFSLPTHRRKRNNNPYSPIRYLRSWWGSGTSSTSTTPLRTYTLLLLFTVLLLFSAYKWHTKYQIQLEFSIFSRKWIETEIKSIKPLKGCFNPSKMSPHYNLTQHLAPKRQTLSSGLSLRHGMSCYDFSSTIQPIPDEPIPELLYHTYWRSDLIPFGKRHASLLTSFLATQPLERSKLILWTNGLEVVGGNEFVRPFVEDWGEYIEVRQVDMGELTKGTDLEGILGGGVEGKGGVWDEKGWVDGDAIRLLVLWHLGGVWLDMDMILTRDLHPLVEQEFVTQWDCYDKPYFSLNGALMHFQKHSPYLCEFFHIMSTSPLPSPSTFTWGSHLYSHLHRSLLSSHLKPFTVLPWCFSDPRNCREDIRFPDPFLPDPPHWGGLGWDEGGGRELLEEKVGFVWAVHLHNQWGRVFWEGGWVERLLGGYEEKVREIKRYRASIGRI